MNRLYKTLLSGLFVALASAAMASTVWYVNGGNGSDTNTCTSSTAACKTIERAISLASSGDTISVAAAKYAENLTIGISLTILGSGASTAIIDGGSKARVVTISGGVANVILSRLTIQNGLAIGGGGILNSGNTLAIRYSVITSNQASASCSVRQNCYSWGGGVYNSGTLTITNTTLSGNSARVSCSPNPCYDSTDGGGIYNLGRMTITNSTLSGNLAWHSLGLGFGRGGAISNRGAATISNSTLSGNAANSGGGINNYTGYNVVLQNSLVANSSSGGNCLGTMTSNGYNLSSDGTCSFTHAGDMNNTDPMLGPSQNNGGPTNTMALPSGSPALDAGNPNGCTDGLGNLLKTDQRGQPRPDPEDAGGCDIGAYERQSD